jgi:hypothetical protein
MYRSNLLQAVPRGADRSQPASPIGAVLGYRDRFPGIQLRLHLDRIPAALGSVSAVRTRDRQDLGSLFTAYRATGRKVEASMNNPWARPMRIAELASRLDQFDPLNRKAFEHYRDTFAAATAPIRLEAPAYDLGRDGYLLLDGNHRIAALFMADIPFELTLVVLHAPVDRKILVDLRYWDGGLRRFFNRSRRETSADRARRAHHLP